MAKLRLCGIHSVYNHVEYALEFCEPYPVAIQCASTLTLNQLEPIKQQIWIALLTRIRERNRERQVCTGSIATICKRDNVLRVVGAVWPSDVTPTTPASRDLAKYLAADRHAYSGRDIVFRVRSAALEASERVRRA